MTLSDIERLIEIFNDMKHRAVSLRQLSFFLCCHLVVVILVFAIVPAKWLTSSLISSPTWPICVELDAKTLYYFSTGKGGAAVILVYRTIKPTFFFQNNKKTMRFIEKTKIWSLWTVLTVSWYEQQQWLCTDDDTYIVTLRHVKTSTARHAPRPQRCVARPALPLPIVMHWIFRRSQTELDFYVFDL